MPDFMLAAVPGQVGRFMDSMDRLLRVSPEEMTPEQAVLVWTVVEGVEKMLAARKGNLRESLLRRVMEGGAETEKGHRDLVTGSGRVRAERRVTRKLDPIGVEALLRSKSIPLEDGGRLRFEPLDDRIAVLIREQRISAEAVAKCVDSKEIFALKVEPTPEISALITSQVSNGNDDGGV